MPKRPKEPQQHRWQIYHLRGTPAQFLGLVEAPNEAAAITKAIVELNVPLHIQDRLLAVRHR
jgi:hypothetical protein